MASGKSHDSATILLYRLLILIGATSWLSGYSGLPIFSGLGAMAGLWLSPDLDLPKCRARRRWNDMGLGWLWVPYEVVLPHRSKFSHWPLLGTTIRLLYLGWPTVALVSLEVIKVDHVFQPWTLAIAVGLMIADTLHWIMDGCPVKV